MDKLIDFLLNNYVWFLVGALILIFALIGYLVDSTISKDSKKIKPISLEESEEERKVVVHPSVQAYTNDQFDAPLINEKNY